MNIQSRGPRSVIIIPARGGSKGIPGKNLKLLGGKPLVAWSIEAALNNTFGAEVYVSSDCDKILATAEKFGARVIKRPSELAQDTSTSEVALQHAVEQLLQSFEIDYVVFLQCTSPIRQGNDIDNAMQTLLNEQADSLLSVIPSHKFLWEINNGHAYSINYDFSQRPRRQDMRQQYQENGSIYIFKPWVLTELNNRLGGKVVLYPMSPESAIDIDTELDLYIAQAIMNASESAQQEGIGFEK